MAVAVLAMACGSSTPTVAPSESPTVAPSESPTLNPDPTPTSSQEPLPTLPPDIPPQPIQEPELTSADEIAEALSRPEMAEQAVVSMLDALGIGIYNTDGSPIRRGSERSDADFYMFEPEVRGLIDMLQEQDEPDTWISFRDFHATLANQGYQGTAEALAQAYADAYAEAVDDPIVKFVTATAFPDVEASFPRFGAWMLLLDGFIPPHASDQPFSETGYAAAIAGGPVALASQPPPHYSMYGRARDRIRDTVPNLPTMNVDPALIARFMTVLGYFSITVRAGAAHEGHGGRLGDPLIVTAQVVAAPGALVSPFTGTAIMPATNNPVEGLMVTWHPDDVAIKHGTLDPLTATAAVFGGVRATYTPRREKADGHGNRVSATSTLRASVRPWDVIHALYPDFPDLSHFLPSEVSGTGPMIIQWHDEVMAIELTNKYNVTIRTVVGPTHTDGTDTFIGQLTQVDDGSWFGVVDATAIGNFNGTAFGQSCRSNWNATQRVIITGTQIPNTGKGDFIFKFYPAENPTGSLGRGKCPPALHKRGEFKYAPYNDLVVTSPDEGFGVTVTLPPKPGGGEEIIRVPSPGGAISITNTTWKVHVSYPTPP